VTTSTPRPSCGASCFFEDGVRVSGHYVGNRYPNDYELSVQIRRTGRLVAWPDVDLAHHLGVTEQEFRRDPAYYVRDYALKLFSASRLTGQARRWLRGGLPRYGDARAPARPRLPHAARARDRRRP
jgi:hypothetical protein